MWRRASSRLGLTRRLGLARHLLRLAAVGYGRRGRAEVLAVGAETLLRRAVARKLPPERPRFVTLDVGGRPWRTAVREFTDLDVALHVLREGVYDIALDPPPEVVLDLGSNIGVSVLWFRHRFPRATIVAVEPDPRAFALLERNVAGLPGTHVLNAAVAGRTGRRTLALAEATVSSSLGDAGSAGVPVEAVTIESIKQRFSLPRIDLVKIDVEGAEWEALHAWDGIGEPAGIVGEFHPAALPVPFERMLSVLDGYTVQARGERTGGHFEFIATRGAARGGSALREDQEVA